MIQEDYVNFGCAKLLKEKGFPQELGEKGCVNTIPYYTQNGEFVTCDLNTIRQRFYPEAAAPTLQMVKKWLRKQNLFLWIGKDSMGFWFRIKDNTTLTSLSNVIGGHTTYEEATLSAIMYCLNNLI